MSNHEFQNPYESHSKAPAHGEALSQYVWDGMKSGIATGAGVAMRVVMDVMSGFTLEAPNPAGQIGAPVIQEAVRDNVADLLGVKRTEK